MSKRRDKPQLGGVVQSWHSTGWVSAAAVAVQQHCCSRVVSGCRVCSRPRQERVLGAGPWNVLQPHQQGLAWSPALTNIYAVAGVWDIAWLRSKAWDKKTWRGRIIISLTIAGAKNSVTIFALEPNCSQTPSDVYSVEENYPAFQLRNNHRVRIPRQRIFLSFILYPFETFV